ncbi:SDR family NAD(P)-dependent oxidoreductase [Halococcus hamelinensis]|uniref:Short-chain dehydrogenase/reductase SDR n=1 Tax=Halococcus hamelinensis 100A6 TaxID=1132509 RepID=M0M097_9EURY|nr:glucose 1-dehydrogenase [Halococcus hamelinensis]EMA39091.1 short-chain dehydrogenase/reductase SDR [Halococcus hamelinensis 100A6]
MSEPGLDRFSLDGRVALVTGASRGIGEAIAVELAAAGASVAALARSEDDLDATVERIESAGGEAIACPADVTDEEEVTVAFDAAEALGPVDVLVNDAGTNPFFGDARDLDIETWERILSVNLTGAFRCAAAFGRRVGEREGTGAVVNVASVGGVVGLPYQTPYVASKHAMVGMTRTLAVEWAPEIRVNALAPGYVETAFTAGVRENDSIYEDLLDEIPQDRFADPEEVAGAAVYLASDAASYTTGEVHVVDGGYAAH